MSASADVVFRQLSVQESYEFYGNSIDIVYYSTTGYKRATLNKSVNGYSYNRPSVTDTIVGTNIPDWVKSPDLTWVVYGASLSDYSPDPQYLGVEITPNVHFADCTGLRFACAGYLASTTVSSAAYDDSFINLHGLTDLRYSNSAYRDGDIYPYWRIDRGNGAFRVMPVWCDYQNQTISNVSLMKIGLNGVRLDGQRLNIYLSCPLVNDGATGGTGIVTGTTAPSQGDINVNVDLDETNELIGESNTLIGRIIDFLHYIGETIVGDESEVEVVEPIMTAEHPPDYDAALSEAESVMDDIPDITASGGFIWEIYKRFMDTSPVVKWLVPFGLILTIFSYIFWKK